MTNGEKLKQMFPELVFNRVPKTDCVCYDLYRGMFPILTGCAKNGWWDSEYKESCDDKDNS